MARTSTYLNFPGTTEAAFLFYQSVFGGEFEGGMMRVKDAPLSEGQSAPSEADGNLVMHVALPILGGHMLMGTDATASMGRTVVTGNNVFINLEPDTRAEADRLFVALSEGGTVDMPIQVMFWGDYFGSVKDKFGICWMVNTSAKA